MLPMSFSTLRASPCPGKRPYSIIQEWELWRTGLTDDSHVRRQPQDHVNPVLTSVGGLRYRETQEGISKGGVSACMCACVRVCERARARVRVCTRPFGEHPPSDVPLRPRQGKEPQLSKK